VAISPIDKSQRTAAKIAGLAFPISFVIVVAVNFGIFAPLIIRGNPAEASEFGTTYLECGGSPPLCYREARLDRVYPRSPLIFRIRHCAPTSAVGATQVSPVRRFLAGWGHDPRCLRAP